MSWRAYEQQVFETFKQKYPNFDILYNQKLPGRFSKVQRQIDILVKLRAVDIDMFGVFDCKYFTKNVDVKVIDSMVGFMADVGAKFGGIVTTKKFSVGAQNRASIDGMDLRTITFTSPEAVVDKFVPSLDFSDPRNSMYFVLLMGT